MAKTIRLSEQEFKQEYQNNSLLSQCSHLVIYLADALIQSDLE